MKRTQAFILKCPEKDDPGSAREGKLFCGQISFLTELSCWKLLYFYWTTDNDEAHFKVIVVILVDGEY